jgi:hypothetical protein
MKSLFFVILIISSMVASFAAPPESVAGFVYYEESVAMTRSNSADGRLLLSDGSFRGIFNLSTYGFNTPLPPSDGKWSYRTIGPEKAELTLQGGDLGGIKILTFLTADRGTMAEADVNRPARVGGFLLKKATDLPPQTNSSNRTFVRPGGVAFAGFVVTEYTNRVLVRAVGPGLAAFGVQSPLAHPVLRMYSGQFSIAENVGWNTAAGAESLKRSAAFVGAFWAYLEKMDTNLGGFTFV